MNAFSVIAVSAPSVATVTFCIGIFIKHGGRGKRRAGAYAVMYALFFSFGRFLGDGPEYTEVAKDPEWKKRDENGDPPEPLPDRQSLSD